MNNIKIKNNNFCAICGKTFIPNGISTGYGVNKDGYKICYNCCGDIDKKQLSDLQPGDKMYLYLTSEKKELSYGIETKHFVTNWPGTLKINCYVKEGYHNIARVQRSIWFSFNGKNYFGKQYGNYSEVCTVKRIK